MAAHYTSDEVSLLSTIRADILKKPDRYREGLAFLESEYGPQRLYLAALQEWQRFKDEPIQRASNLASAERGSRGITDPDQRKARFREVLEHISAKPKPERWTPAVCACAAIRGLSGAAVTAHYDARAHAVLILGVLLWDADADKRHPIFTVFGPWGTTSAGEIETIGRWAALFFLQGEADLRRWMNSVNMAWAGLATEHEGELTEKPPDHTEPHQGFFVPADIAKALNAQGKADSIRKALERLLRDHRLPDSAWLENNNPGKGQAKILYKLSDVRPFLARFEAFPNR